MTTIVAMVRFLNAMQARTSETRIAKVGYQVPSPSWRRLLTTKKNNAAAFMVVGCLGLFLGGMDDPSWLVHETGSSGTYMVGTLGKCVSPSWVPHDRSLNFRLQSMYKQVERKEVPKSLDPRYRSFQE
jgi:hypothetical protein